MKMNLKETKHLTTVEYGSGFQQLADSESDVDEMSLVLQPFENTVFKGVQEGTHHDENNDRFYSVERFVHLALRGNSDALLLLSAQLTQARDEEVNNHVFRTFYDYSDAFGELLVSRQREYVHSLLGQLRRYLKTNKNAKMTGKTWLKEVVTAHKLYHVMAVVQDECQKPTFDNYIEQSQNTKHLISVYDVLPYKRYTYEQLEDVPEFKHYMAHERPRVKQLIKRSSHGFDFAQSFHNKIFKYKDEWVENLMQFLIKHRF